MAEGKNRGSQTFGKRLIILALMVSLLALPGMPAHGHDNAMGSAALQEAHAQSVDVKQDNAASSALMHDAVATSSLATTTHDDSTTSTPTQSNTSEGALSDEADAHNALRAELAAAGLFNRENANKNPKDIIRAVEEETRILTNLGASNSQALVEEEEATFSSVCTPNAVSTTTDSAAGTYGLLTYETLFANLCTLQNNPRITVKIIGKSQEGRSIPAIIVSDPQTPEEQAKNEEIRKEILGNPEVAASKLQGGEYQNYKPMLAVSGNIHGNEYEGTDAIINLATYLANAQPSDRIIANTEGLTSAQIAAIPTVKTFLSQYQLVLFPSINLDGRHNGTRSNSFGIDLNRDHLVTASPEVKAYHQAIYEFQPVALLDLHGYFSPSSDVFGLLEPSTPIHAPTLEYDLFSTSISPVVDRANSEVMRRSTVTTLRPEATKIGVARDDMKTGEWDDWFPGYTSVWASHVTGAAITVEAPFTQDAPDHPATAKSVAGNIEFFRGVIDALLTTATDSQTLLANQIELFRRGTTNQVPGTMPDSSASQPYQSGWHLKTNPASPGNLFDLVRLLQSHHIQVYRVTTSGSPLGQVGDFIVPAHQARRNVAATLLNTGENLTSRGGKSTTDIAAWSPAALWDVKVSKTASDLDLQNPGSQGVERLSTTPLPATPTVEGQGPWRMRIGSYDDVRFVHYLRKNGIVPRWDKNGFVYIPSTSNMVELAKNYTVHLAQVPSIPSELPAIATPRIGVIGSMANLTWLHELGFNATTVSPLSIKEDATYLDQFDVIVATRTIWGANQTIATNLQHWLRKDHGMVLSGASGLLGTLGITQPSMAIGGGGLIATTTTPAQDVLPPNQPANGSGNSYQLSHILRGWENLQDGITPLQNLKVIPGEPVVVAGLQPKKSVPTNLAVTIGTLFPVGAQPSPSTGNIIATEAILLTRHMMRGQTDELFAAIQAVSPKHGAGPTVERIAGADRIATALQVSARYTPATTNTVVLAGATAWPDAIAGGPLAVKEQAPLLLVHRDQTPVEVEAELARLQPSTVYVLGGPAAISNANLLQLQTTFPAISFIRLAGPTRYDTAAAIAGVFPDETNVVVTSGGSFPDALTGGVLAGYNQGVVLPVPSSGAIPAAVVQQLNRRSHKNLTIIGGNAAVSTAVEQELTTHRPTHAPAIQRLKGSTRYETAKAVAISLVASGLASETPVTLASGTSFPDALVSGPLVVREHGLLLLTERDSLPPGVNEYLTGIRPTKIQIMGGNSVISFELQNLLEKIR